MLLSFKLGGYSSFKDMEEIFFTPYPGTRLKILNMRIIFQRLTNI